MNIKKAGYYTCFERPMGFELKRIFKGLTYMTYINVNRPFSGNVQERPVFSNINNGIGLFSSRYTYDEIYGIELTNATVNYMINDLDLGFE